MSEGRLLRLMRMSESFNKRALELRFGSGRGDLMELKRVMLLGARVRRKILELKKVK